MANIAIPGMAVMYRALLSCVSRASTGWAFNRCFVDFGDRGHACASGGGVRMEGALSHKIIQKRNAQVCRQNFDLLHPPPPSTPLEGCSLSVPTNPVLRLFMARWPASQWRQSITCFNSSYSMALSWANSESWWRQQRRSRQKCRSKLWHRHSPSDRPKFCIFNITSLRECHAHSAKFWMSANTRTLVSAPFHKFLVLYQGFF